MAAFDPFARSICCSYRREFVDYGDVREDGILPTWDHPLYRELRAGEVERSCGTCAGTQGSHGGCRSTAYAFHRRWGAPDRSEEHTSELQSLMRISYAVFCLKKKTTQAK